MSAPESSSLPGLSDTRLQEIEQRMSKATPGPWAWFGNTRYREAYLATVRHGRRFVMQFGRWGMNGAQPLFQSEKIMRDIPELVERGEIEVDHNGAMIRVAHPDADFIAHSRQDIPDLLAEVRRLQGAIRQHEEDEASVCPEDVGFVEYIRALESQLASAREETAQLREELKIATTPDIYGIEDTIVDADDLYSLDLGVGDVAQVWANRVLGNRWVACLALPDSDDYECAVFDTEAEARAAIASSTPIPEGADRAE